MAKRGKTSVGWFYGFKVHIVVNDCGDLLSWALSAGIVDDRTPIPQALTQIQPLVGAWMGDTGYLSQPLAPQVWEEWGVHLLTRKRKNMRTQPQDTAEQAWLLRKRALIETVFDQLKNISQIEHSHHRSPPNFVVHLTAGLVAYCHQPKQPSLHLERLALCVA